VDFLVAAAALQTPPQGPTAAALAATKIEKVKDNLYIITGSGAEDQNAFSGGNTAVFVTAADVVIVDTKLPGWGQTIIDRIKTVTDKPITTISIRYAWRSYGATPLRRTSEIVHENKSEHGQDGRLKGDKATFLPKKIQSKLTVGNGRDRPTSLHRSRPYQRRYVRRTPQPAAMHAGDCLGKALPSSMCRTAAARWAMLRRLRRPFRRSRTSTP
jgi:hypothetical protein